MLKNFLSLFFISGLLALFSSVSANFEFFNGTWEGQGYQANDNSKWKVKYVIDGQTSVFYFAHSDLECGGKSTLKNVFKNSIILNEKLSFGIKKCVDNGKTELRKIDNDTIKYIWRYKDGRQGAEGVLRRKKNISQELSNKLVGSWKGTYTCTQGYTGMTLDVPSSNLQKIIWNSYWDLESKGEPYATIVTNAEVDFDGKFEMYGYEWVKKPGPGWMLLSHNGNYDGSPELNILIHQDGCTTFNARKVRGVSELVEEIQRAEFVDFEIPFEGNHWRVQKSAKKELDKLGQLLLSDELTEGTFELVGHVSGTSGTHKTCIDENHKVVGSSKYAKECWETDADWAVALSERRANSTKDYLIKNFSVDKNRIKAYGVGNTQHKISDPDNPGNRRVEVKYIKNK
jgi:outer membrane protein OmpA-like peptidoglycan-associated protein